MRVQMGRRERDELTIRGNATKWKIIGERQGNKRSILVKEKGDYLFQLT